MRSEKELADKHAEEHKDFLNVPAIKLGPQTWTREMSQNAGVSPTAAGSVPQAAHAPTMGAEKRKQHPLCSGVLDYFPDALMEVAHCSWVGNQQHNPGQPLHWAKEKSTDEPDALLRHLKDRGTLDTDGVRHSAKVAWRALALLQREIERERREGAT
jgi:hypothetical protein